MLNRSELRNRTASALLDLPVISFFIIALVEIAVRSNSAEAVLFRSSGRFNTPSEGSRFEKVEIQKVEFFRRGANFALVSDMAGQRPVAPSYCDDE